MIIDLNEDIYDDDVVEVNADEQGPSIPCKGMCFVSDEELATLCHNYAYKLGFTFLVQSSLLMDEYKALGVRRTGVGKLETQNHMLKRLRLHCKMGGRKQTMNSQVSDCKVFVEGRMVEGRMEITGCLLEHKHTLHPNSSRFMVNYRNIDCPTHNRIVINDRSAIPISRNFNQLVVENGGQENVPYNQRDVRNVVNLERRMSRIQGDAVALEEYFRKQHDADKNFYSCIQNDEIGTLMNAFWYDSRSRATWKDFGDIITFDTTFLANRYKMPFAPFVCVNHHGKSIVFVSALLSHEDSDTFEWVFKQWLLCMVKNLGSLTKWSKIGVAIHEAVHDFLDADEFDEAWRLIIETCGLQANPWMKEMYEIRQRWAPGHWRTTFWAGMSSTQRSERMNRFFKGYVNVETGLSRFLLQYEAAMKVKLEEEKIMDSQSVQPPLPVDKTVLVEYVFHKKYTNAKFAEVRKQSVALKHTNATKTGALGSLLFYRADENVATRMKWKQKKSYFLSIDKEKGEFSCSCKLFEFSGILCRHLIRVIDTEVIQVIPDKYILDRWRKNKVRGYEDIRVSYYHPEESARVKKNRDFSQRHTYLPSLPMHNDATLLLYKEATKKIRSALEAEVGVENTGTDG
ncbi:protein FAR1-RELATED SEQUENCE 5-like [Spinacia oleracea]|uniref:Protein FAR1-RELATED SEQUENCE 5-like n=1 Tax=Spinacia oleracea TaxID=3562 RepID=A0A9R0JWQ5_SPIOL|nr:protein FAR1-RELATED SEQUENCE 5-like [Spinacia oleracea]